MGALSAISDSGVLDKKLIIRGTGISKFLKNLDRGGGFYKDQKIASLDRRVSNLEKENDPLKQENAIQEKLTELAKREAEVYRIAFEKEMELTDRALKLAGVGKPKSNWELTRFARAGRLCLMIFGRGIRTKIRSFHQN